MTARRNKALLEAATKDAREAWDRLAEIEAWDRLAEIESVIADVIGLKPGMYTPAALRHALDLTRRTEREAGIAIGAMKLRAVEASIDEALVEATGATRVALEELDHAAANVWCCAEYRASSGGTEQHSEECGGDLCDADCSSRLSKPGESVRCDCGWGHEDTSHLMPGGFGSEP